LKEVQSMNAKIKAFLSAMAAGMIASFAQSFN